jgi:two-component system, LytTR family, response regulator
MNKVMDAKQEISTSEMNSGTLIVKTLKGCHLSIGVEEIAYCKADGSYTNLVLKNGKEVVVTRSIKAIEKHLEQYNFIRCHNSYLINIGKVEKFDGNKKILTVLGQGIPVSRRKCCKTMMKLKTLNNQL